ncbi:MAG: energy-coupling factor transporter transmembrane protein EcfT [Treponemataceae bacterium]|nr:energy-coupling factor transporter transmembrane protein EcfT [Treponemataceae bacterium]
MELLKSGGLAGGRKSLLDPRTKLLLLAFVSVFVLGNAGGDAAAEFRVALNYLPLLLLLGARRWGAVLFAVFFYTLSYALAVLVMPHCTGFLNFLVLAMTGIVLRFMPGILTGMFVVSTTTVSEFIAAMERMHVSQKITIPLAVMFRFFPTVVEETGSINKAMAMRDIKFGGKKVLKMIEYRLIPMMTCSVKIGQELSAASLTRGLGSPEKRTNICKIGFGWCDAITFCALGGGLVYVLLRAFGVL